MKKLASFSLSLVCGMAAFGQVIQGKIWDAQTQRTLPYASVYFSGTLVGTASNENGHFQLDVSKYSSYPLIIRAIGYEPYTLDLTSGKDHYQVYLQPSSIEIEEVAVSTQSLVRKRKAYLRLFRSEFLGTTGNQRHCSILNEEDITFNYHSDKDTVKAVAREPMVVYNGSLGYLITYYLDEFSYDKKRDVVTFIGDIAFREDLALRDPDKARYYLRKREQAYAGSCMHFFRALWANKLEANGFSVKRSSFAPFKASAPVMYAAEKELTCQDMVIQDNREQKYLMYSGKLEINHLSRISILTLLKARVPFEQNGYYDPSAIRWDGHMSEQRVADMLPYEYAPLK